MNDYDGLMILGFGGHARSVADVALDVGIRQLLFVDENAQPGERFLDFAVQHYWPDTLAPGWAAFAASGDGRCRHALVQQVRSRGWPLATLVARSATLGVGATLGEGSFVGRHAHIGPMAQVGTCCIINTAAIVEHESQVGDYTHVSVRTTIAGRSQVGTHCFIGAGATVVDGVSVADGIVIGAAACVHRTLEMHGTYVGVPVRRVSEVQS